MYKLMQISTGKTIAIIRQELCNTVDEAYQSIGAHYDNIAAENKEPDIVFPNGQRYFYKDLKLIEVKENSELQYRLLPAKSLQKTCNVVAWIMAIVGIIAFIVFMVLTEASVVGVFYGIACLLGSLFISFICYIVIRCCDMYINKMEMIFSSPNEELHLLH